MCIKLFSGFLKCKFLFEPVSLDPEERIPNIVIFGDGVEWITLYPIWLYKDDNTSMCHYVTETCLTLPHILELVEVGWAFKLSPGPQ